MWRFVIRDAKLVELGVNFFFFSSRRRHTRCGRGWSSDVCSSDLAPVNMKGWIRQRKEQLQAARAAAKQRRDLLKAEILSAAQDVAREERIAARQETVRQKAEIGRAS